MKKIAIGIVIGVLLATAIPVAAETVYEKLTATVRTDYKVMIDGETAQLEKSPTIINESTYLPAKAVAELFGKEVDFKGGTIMITTPTETEIIIPGAAEHAKKTYGVLQREIEITELAIQGYGYTIDQINNGQRPESDRAAAEKSLEADLEYLEKTKQELADLIAKYPELESSN